ncbi:MAG TPA: sorbosone dehydrogenase family protein [Stellaceae bacterium]|nr:sorbosone dehydrogenase family protein [Stellaceae bacterium]
MRSLLGNLARSAVPALALAWFAAGPTQIQAQETPSAPRTGRAAYGDWRGDAPGVRRKITPADLPPPFSTDSAGDDAGIVARPAGALPAAPPGFTVQLFASGLDNPRLVRVAPNGDIFIAESRPGRLRVLRAADGAAAPERMEVFASGLNQPFGIAFYPSGPNPQYVYVGNTDSVVRFPYRNGDLAARGPAELVARDIPGGGRLRGGGHWTRDLAFSKNDAKLFVSVGSASNDAEGMPPRDGADMAKRPLGAAWGVETGRADVLQFDAAGGNGRIFATGLRNCVGMAVQPATGDLWCSTNERDGLGDDLPPDYITRVRDGGFYGWPWYYIGAHEDPHHKGERPDLAGKVTVPDVLLQPHSASLEMTFYNGGQFPAAFRGDAFAAEHGSWNRANRTGYKIIRVPLRDGRPTGEYEDFLTGFVTPSGGVWGRPVGVAVAHDGALIVTEDAHGTVWRIAYAGGKAPQ